MTSMFPCLFLDQRSFVSLLPASGNDQQVSLSSPRPGKRCKPSYCFREWSACFPIFPLDHGSFVHLLPALGNDQHVSLPYPRPGKLYTPSPRPGKWPACFPAFPSTREALYTFSLPWEMTSMFPCLSLESDQHPALGNDQNVFVIFA